MSIPYSSNIHLIKFAYKACTYKLDLVVDYNVVFVALYTINCTALNAV